MVFVLASFPVVISWWLMAAHFLRGGNFFLVLTCFFAPGLLFFEEKWAARTLQVGLFLASFEWAHTLINLVQERIMSGQPYTLLVVILGTVTLFTFSSSFVFLIPTMRCRFKLEPPPANASGNAPEPPSSI